MINDHPLCPLTPGVHVCFVRLLLFNPPLVERPAAVGSDHVWSLEAWSFGH